MHLIDIRRRLGITQSEMAASLEVAAAYLSAVENGAKPVSNALLVRLEEKFAVSRRDKVRLRELAKASAIQRRMPQSAHTRAYIYIEDLWTCMSELDHDDWVALHAVLDVIQTNRHRKAIGEQMGSE